MNKSPFAELAPACRNGNVLASAKFPRAASFFHLMALLMPSRPDQVLAVVNAARLSRSNGSAMATLAKHCSFGRTERLKIHLQQRVCS
jgi:hypothetical protein